MTAMHIKRCVNCCSRYTYQASGPDADEFNDRHLCPSCKEVSLNALRKVPRAAEKVIVPVDGEAERASVLAECDRLRKLSTPNFFGMRVTRIAPGRFSQDGGYTNVEVINFEYTTYYIETWSDNREPERITKEMARYIDGGFLEPW